MIVDNYSQTIDRALVHKRSLGEVLVTGLAAAPTGWTIHAQIPRGHRLHSDVTGDQQGYHDPLLIMEAFRQGCIAASHTLYEVPLNARHTLRNYELSLLDFDMLERGARPLELEIGVLVREEFRRRDDGPVQGLEISAVAIGDGVKIMELQGAFGWMSAEKWAAFRGDASWDPGPQPVRADPRLVGRTYPGNVMIGEPTLLSDGAGSAAIVVDVDDPTMFDHPLDHLPGGLIVEASRQLCVALLGPYRTNVVGPTVMRCEFRSFAEMGPEVRITMTPLGGSPLAFCGLVTQSGHTRAIIELAFAAG